jgi:D-sedoheptulose 7-phosphate isomerase
MSTFSRLLEETSAILSSIDDADVEAVVAESAATAAGDSSCADPAAAPPRRTRPRLPEALGHRVYSVTDNISELTARINDDGWENSYADWLRVRIRADDCLFVFSAGGGDAARASAPTWWRR